jgi:hypothetical protein
LSINRRVKASELHHRWHHADGLRTCQSWRERSKANISASEIASRFGLIRQCDFPTLRGLTWVAIGLSVDSGSSLVKETAGSQSGSRSPAGQAISSKEMMLRKPNLREMRQ